MVHSTLLIVAFKCMLFSAIYQIHRLLQKNLILW